MKRLFLTQQTLTCCLLLIGMLGGFFSYSIAQGPTFPPPITPPPTNPIVLDPSERDGNLWYDVHMEDCVELDNSGYVYMQLPVEFQGWAPLNPNGVAGITLSISDMQGNNFPIAHVNGTLNPATFSFPLSGSPAPDYPFTFTCPGQLCNFSTSLVFGIDLSQGVPSDSTMVLRLTGFDDFGSRRQMVGKTRIFQEICPEVPRGGTSMNNRLGQDKENRFVVVPNPFSDQLTIEVPEPQLAHRLTLLDLHGRKVKEITFSKDRASLVLPTADLPRGGYLLRIQAEGAAPAYHKLIKMD